MRKERLFILLALLVGLVPFGTPKQEAAQVQAAALTAGCATDLIISEYIEGSSSNKAVEVYNGTGTTVDLTGYSLTIYTNGNTSPGNSYDFTGTLAAGDTFVVANPSADAAILSVADATDDVTYYNGNDAVVLSKDGAFIDVLGEVGNGASWGDEMTLVRKAGVTTATTTFNLAEWDAYPQDTFDYLGSHTMTCGTVEELLLDKSAPPSVAVGKQFTYTLTINNQTLQSLTSVVLTDTLPSGATFVSASEGGVEASGVVSWSIVSLAAGTIVSRTLVVAAPAASGSLVNDDYVVSAAEWTTPTIGAAVTTSVFEDVTIYDIQYTTADPANSPYAGEMIGTTGIVYAVYSDGFAIAEDSGAWHGVYVYHPSDPKPNIGDEVHVVGQVKEYWGLTEIAENPTYTVLSSGNTPYASVEVTTAEVATGATEAESYEGVFVHTRNVTVTDDDLGYGEWEITDSSGVGARVDDMGRYTYQPALDDALYLVRGMLYYSHSDFKIEPRDDEDIIVTPPAGLTIMKDGPLNVASNSTYSYELTVRNYTGGPLNNLVITDVLPVDTDFVSASAGGTLSGGVVTWNVTDLDDTTDLDLTLTVTATGSTGSFITNDEYGVTASNWTTPSLGVPVTTYVGAYLPIPLIQGKEYRSPLVGENVTTVGIVTGFFEGNASSNFDGFYIQTESGDGDPNTSDAIYVKYSTSLNPGVSVGDFVTVTGIVDEFSEWDGPSCTGVQCQTQIFLSDTTDVEMGGSETLPALIEVNPPADPTTALAYWESREGMRVTVSQTATVVGPTSYGTIMVVDGDLGVDRVFRTGPHAGKPVGVRHYERYGDIAGSDAPSLIVGSVVEEVDGPLAYTYGNYVVVTQEGDPWTVVSEANLPAVVPTWPGADQDEFSVATFNTLNFDEVAKMDKVVGTIESMGCPTFVALQEIEMDTTLPQLKDALADIGCSYNSANSHEDVGNHGVALIWRTDRVSNYSWSTEYQGCSAVGSGSSTAYDTYCDGTGLLPLFSRRPVVFTGTVNLREVVVIANHFKSKRGGDPADDQRRLEQAQLVADLVDEFSTTVPNVIVMGDLNDFEDSPPLEALYASGNLTNTWYTIPQENRYSYIYKGASQILDHILISPALLDDLVAVAPLHYNADYPFAYSLDPTVVWGTSDHDQVAATIAVPLDRIYLPLVVRNYP